MKDDIVDKTVPRQKSGVALWCILGMSVIFLFTANLFCGSVHIPWGDTLRILMGRGSNIAAQEFIVLQTRLPAAVTALLTGAALAASGLMLQTTFANPLAGPDILGINSGACLGVAIVMLSFGGMTTIHSPFSIIGAAFMGAMVITALILFFSALTHSHTLLLIIGLMISYIVSSFVTLLNFFSTAEGVQSYMLWGFGSFNGVSLSQLPIFTVIILIGLTLCICLVKPLNALLLGDRYAENLGVPIRLTRILLLLSTGLLVAITTAYCGPISFIGLAVPHIARLFLGTNDHRRLMPATMLCGSAIALLCLLLCTLPGQARILPLGAVTPLIGAPVVIYVILKMKRQG